MDFQNQKSSHTLQNIEQVHSEETVRQSDQWQSDLEQSNSSPEVQVIEQKSEPIFDDKQEDHAANSIILQKALGLPTHQPDQNFSFLLAEIFEHRARDIRIANFVVITLNIFNQLYALRRIDNRNMQIIHSIYWILTILSTLLTALSYQNGRLMLTKYGYVILSFRNILRLYNFEKLESSNLINLSQQVLCIFMLQFFVVNFEWTKENKKIKWFITIFWSIGQTKIQGFLQFQTFGKTAQTIVYVVLQQILIVTMVRLISNIVKGLIKQTEKNYDMQDEFHQILQNLEESIIIISDFRAEFVNKRFLSDFSHIVKQIPENVEEEKKEENPSSWLKRTKIYLQKIFLRKGNIEQAKEEAPIPAILTIQLFQAVKTYEKGLESLQSTSKLISKSQVQLKYSFQEIIQKFQTHNLNNVVFSLCENIDQKIYFQIKLTKFERKNRQKIMVQFIDISKTILYDQEKSHNIVLSMINACVSHEMRNPLNSINAQNIEKTEIYKEINQLVSMFKRGSITNSEFLLQHGLLMNTLKNGLKVQQSSANVLTFIVQDLLDYAQIKSGKFRTNILEFNLISAIEEVMLIQQRKAQDNNVRLHVTFVNIKRDEKEHQIDCWFKSPKYSYLINTDQQRVMQVLLGLQSNALKFTQGGEVHIIVKIIKKEGQKFLQIAIQDTGIGIAKENQDKLFKMFGFLEDTQNMNKNGVGLGLAISKQIVQQYEGDISVRSELGVGSTFTFTFKIYPRQFQLERQVNEKKSQFNYNSKVLVYKWKPKIQNQVSFEMPIVDVGYVIKQDKKFQDVRKVSTKILIVDDQSFNIDAMKIILKYSLGLDTDKYCESALSGQQALEMVKSDFESQRFSKYSLILMDCNMPGMDGLETTQKIREYLYSKEVAQPIISAITGHVEQMYVDQAILSGMNQVLSKPVNSLFLKDLVRQLGFSIQK